MRIRHLRSLLPILIFLLSISIPTAAGAEEPPPPFQSFATAMRGVAEGEGTRFAVEGSDYLDVVVESTARLHAVVESHPRMITLRVSAADGATETELSVSGLAPSAQYFVYIDGYEDVVPIQADADGAVSLPLGLAEPRLLFIQPLPSTIHLTAAGFSDPSAGTWDPIARVARMTRDVTETVSIEANNVTLDGAGHAITLQTPVNAVFASGRTGVTVRSLRISGAQRGVYLRASSGALVSDVVVTGGSNGVYLDSSSGNRVEDCSIVSSSMQGAGLWLSSGNTITDNRLAACTAGVVARMMSNDNLVTGNTFTGNALGAGSWADTFRNRWTANMFDGDGLAIQCGDTEGVVAANTISGGQGCSLLDAVGSTFEDNTVTGSRIGINVARSRDCLVRRNTISDGLYGLELYYCTGSLVHSNDFLRNTYQTWVERAAGNRLNAERPVGGNHWDTWTTPDADGDGFVDVAFAAGEATDFLPLARPFHAPSDQTAPVTSIALDPASPDGADGWYVTRPEVTLSAEDDGGAVALTEYSLDGEAWQAYEGPFTVADGEYRLGVRSTDKAGNVEETKLLALRVDTSAPVVTATSPRVVVDEGDIAANLGTVSDGSLSASEGDLTVDAGGAWSWRMPLADGPAEREVRLTASDGHGNVTRCSFVLEGRNVAPVVTAVDTVLAPMLLGTPLSLSATYSDPGALDTHNAVWDWGDGTTSAGIIEASGGVRGQHTYASAGVYEVAVSVTDDDGGTGTASFEYYAVVYDPAAGFVTGGGWVPSPAGAWAADPESTGKATFGFVSKYLKGAQTPSGQTEFQFKAGGLDFHSTSYQWLVVAGGKAQYRGTGVAAGYGECTFLLSAVDGGSGTADRFRIRICDKATGQRIYDNQLEAPDNADPSTALGGGAVVVHRD